MTFPGGEVTIPTPTRADLILSAKQWVTAARERAQDSATDVYSPTSVDETLHYIRSCCERIEKALTEAEALK